MLYQKPFTYQFPLQQHVVLSTTDMISTADKSPCIGRSEFKMQYCNLVQKAEPLMFKQEDMNF